MSRESAVTALRAMSLAAFPTVIKPPNVLVLQPQHGADSGYLRLKDSLSACLTPERYVIYPLGLDDALRTPWKENCSLLVVPSRLQLTPPQIYHEIASFVHGGGVLLSLEAAVNAILGFKINEHLEPNQLFDVTPVGGVSGRGNFHVLSVSTIAGVNDVQFAQELPQDPGVSRETLANLICSDLSPPTSPMHQSSTLDVQSPGAEDPVRIPCVQRVRFSKGGHALLSYVDLLSSVHEGGELSVLLQLKKGVESRQAFLRGVLEGVGLECASEAIPELSHTYLLCSSENHASHFLRSLKAVATADVVRGSETSVQLITTDMSSEGTPVDPFPSPSPTSISVFTRPAKWQLERLRFDVDGYFGHLKTAQLGRTVLYTPVIASTQTVFTGNMSLCNAVTCDHGVTCVASQQTQGKGRSGNLWISPVGAMMFSTALKFPPWSRLYHKMPLLQHLVALAVVAGIRDMPGYEEVPVAIKWPNDIYYRDQVKLGGILVSCFTTGGDTTLTAVIGCGVNVCNRHPTMSVNDCISLHNAHTGGSLAPLTVEEVLAATMNKLEMYLGQYEAVEMNAVEQLYYKYWLHSGAKVRLASRSHEEVEVRGIDEYGYLRVQCSSGEELSLQPDGNSFDIMKGLIAMK